MLYTLILALSIPLALSQTTGNGNKVLLISMDGFRSDYIEKWPTPNFDKLAKVGCSGKYINNTFVTKTFPSHYSIVTGLYEESHGIIANTMYDPEFKEIFTARTNEPKWWNGGEPIWVTARKNGLKSATYFWPGSETEIRNYRPNNWRQFNKSTPFEVQINQAVEWLKGDTDIVVVYMYEPDSTGHKYGPNANETKQAVIRMDNVLGYIMKKIEDNELWNDVNLLLVSDHGMTEVDFENKNINISDYISVENDLERYLSIGPFMQITPKSGRVDAVYQALQVATDMTVYLKENIPEFWHYKNNRRVMPILAVADDGWSIVYNKTVSDKGNHGYDNRLMSMKPIFFAAGPQIRSNCGLETFSTIDIYLLMCRILNIQPAPNNGTLVNVHHVLNPLSVGDDKNAASSMHVTFYIISILSSVLLNTLNKWA